MKGNVTAWKVTHWKARINPFHSDQGSLRELTVTEWEAQVIGKGLIEVKRQRDHWGQEMASHKDFNGQPVFQLAVYTNI